MPLTEGLVGLAAQREEAVNLADARLHPRFKLFPEVAEEEYRAFLAVPIIYQKAVVGVIVVQQASARQFSEGEEAFLMTLAAQLAMAVRGLKTKKPKSVPIINKFYFKVRRRQTVSPLRMPLCSVEKSPLSSPTCALTTLPMSPAA